MKHQASLLRQRSSKIALAVMLCLFALLNVQTVSKAQAAEDFQCTYELSYGSATVTGCSNTATSVKLDTYYDYPVTGIDDYAFYDCHFLKSITLPKTLGWIGEAAFGSCSSLTSITIPNGVTSIGDDAFTYCKKLNCLYLPKSLKFVGECAFPSDYDVKINDVYYQGTKADWKKIAFAEENDGLLKHATIHYNCKGIMPKTVKLSKTAFIFDGKVKNPKVTATNSNKQQISTKCYAVTKTTDCKSVGKHVYKIAFKRDYTGTFWRSFVINPAAPKAAQPRAFKKALTAKWKRTSKANATGYQVRWSLKPSMKSAITKKVRGAAKTSLKVTKLKPGKKYYVQVRAYKILKGKTYYSNWSAKKSVTTKGAVAKKGN